ncbi:MAG: 16S rRNA (cytidine(1402)-2'-O)-methyltransferase, partial [Bacteroidales bacterium]|nr:16S rRNA (cytidine(1402)-2'-O)-methyltransferase [Bacteroidales bacterium]
TFFGFIPRKKGRKTFLDTLKTKSETMIFYESPFRLIKTLLDLTEVLGSDRNGTVVREISKVYEETVRGKLNELISHFETKKPKGEIVILVEGFFKNKPVSE